MIDLIMQIISEREQAKLYPYHCPLMELLRRSGKTLPELRELLRPLVKDGIIHIGPTINSYYIKVK